MGVTFVLGRAGSGKSSFMQRQLLDLCKSGKPAIYIVPEQFTFETERELSQALGGGLMGASVFSFTTLSKRVLKEAGERTVFLSAQGRRMLIRKSATELAGELTAFSAVCSRPGFSEKCDELFSLFKRFNITPPALAEAAKKLPAGLLGRKLADLSLLYQDTEDHLHQSYMDESDALNALRSLLPGSFVAGASVIIDGFDLLTEQLYSIIETIMAVADGLCISVRMDPNGGCRDAAVFSAESKAFSRLYAAAKETGLSVRIERMPQQDIPVRHGDPALLHIEKEAFAFPYREYSGPTPSPETLRLFAATSRTQEAEAAAEAVIRTAKRGVRYRDMAVVAADMEAYAAVMARAFDKRGIPYFTDIKHPLAGYAAPRLLMNALTAISRGLPDGPLCALAKTGLAGVCHEDAELFENYCLRFGIRGTAFSRPFQLGEVAPQVEGARAALLPPLLRLREGLSGSASCKDKTRALYAYMQELDIYGQLSRLTENLRITGRLELAEENAQVYNKLMELLDQLYTIMGDAQLATSRYIEIFSEGLSAYDVGAIPTTADQVLFGSVGRTRARSIKALFLVGATQEAFPRYHPDDGVIDDEELCELSALGLTPWDSNAARNGIELANAYGALTKPSQSLYISWPLRVEADPAQPSQLIDRLLALFPGLVVENGLTALPPPECPEGGLLPLIGRLRAFADGQKLPEGTDSLYAYYAKSARYSPRLLRAEEALYHNNSPEPFGRELAQELYGALLSGSPTRMETFNACPFRHFLRYGLKALPRREYKEQKLDEGEFCHEALSRFINKLIEYPDISTAPDTKALLDEILPELTQSHNNGVFLSSARSRARCAELSRRVFSTAAALRRQLALSGFSVCGTEVEFGPNKHFPPLTVKLCGAEYNISGKIDRLDSFTDDSGRYYRVLDYKQGGRDFKYADLYHGLTLQLPLYISAALAADKAARAAGLYYLPIKDPTAPEGTPQEQLEVKLFEEFRLRGLTLDKPEILAATAGEDPDYQMISTRSSGGLLNESRLNTVLTYAQGKAQATLESMMQGRAEISPYYKQDKSTPCKYCDYASVCRFDLKLPGCAYRRLSAMDKDGFFAETGGDET